MKTLINFVKDMPISDDVDNKNVNKIKFILEQLELGYMNQARYSELLVWSPTFSYSFPGAY